MKRVIVDIPGKSYPVLIGESVLQKIKKEIRNIPYQKAVIIDRNVDKLHGNRIRKLFDSLKGNTEYFILPSGENSKSITVLNRIYSFMLRENLGKDSMIFSVGGGVTGDISGFAASTFKRGVPIIHVPTTLLAAVDSSVGGKTAINIKSVKNAAGNFHHPDYVFTDVGFLETLPDPEIISGLGELIKYTFISDPNFFIYVLNNIKKIKNIDYGVLEYIIWKAVSIKGSIVAKDDKEESGLRKILNFGHTFAHAFESVLNFRIKHGEAVTAGIVAALHLSNKLGLLPENRMITYLKLPAKIKLPRTLLRIDFKDVLESMMDDKKNRGGKINFVLLSEIGSMLIDVSAGSDDVKYSLDKMLSGIKTT